MEIKLRYSCLLLAGIVGSAFAQDNPGPAMTPKIRKEGSNQSQVIEADRFTRIICQKNAG